MDNKRRAFIELLSELSEAEANRRGLTGEDLEDDQVRRITEFGWDLIAKIDATDMGPEDLVPALEDIIKKSFDHVLGGQAFLPVHPDVADE